MAAAPAQNYAGIAASQIAGRAAVGYAAAALFTTINPVGGLYFGATSAAVSVLSTLFLGCISGGIIDCTIQRTSSPETLQLIATALVIANLVFSLLVGFAAAFAVTAALGMAISSPVGHVLVISQLAGNFAIGCLYHRCF